MKKVYKRPELFYENFSIMEAIATCPAIANHGDPASCVYYDVDFEISFFAADVNGDCEENMNYYEVAADNIFTS